MIDSGDFVMAIFFDLQKAFDTVDNSNLINKRYFYGIRGSIDNWFKSYLHERKQFTVINNISSSTKTIDCGVPQSQSQSHLFSTHNEKSTVYNIRD